MKIILLKSVPACGQAWETVEVREGFARNFLIPKGFAVPITPQRLEQAKGHRERRKDAAVRQQKKTAAMKQSFLGKVLRMERPASSEGNLFAAISRPEIVAALWEQFRLRVSDDEIEGPTLKTLGQYTWTLKRPTETIPFHVDIASLSTATHEKANA